MQCDQENPLGKCEGELSICRGASMSGALAGIGIFEAGELD